MRRRAIEKDVSNNHRQIEDARGEKLAEAASARVRPPLTADERWQWDDNRPWGSPTFNRFHSLVSRGRSSDGGVTEA